jgi:hypothetical protein
MIYAAVAAHLLTLALLAYVMVTLRNDARAAREQAAKREDALLNRIQAPQLAVAQSATEQAGPVEPGHISAFDDVALAKFELERDRLFGDTEAFIAANAGVNDED